MRNLLYSSAWRGWGCSEPDEQLDVPKAPSVTGHPGKVSWEETPRLSQGLLERLYVPVGSVWRSTVNMTFQDGWTGTDAVWGLINVLWWLCLQTYGYEKIITQISLKPESEKRFTRHMQLLLISSQVSFSWSNTHLWQDCQKSRCIVGKGV